MYISNNQQETLYNFYYALVALTGYPQVENYCSFVYQSTIKKRHLWTNQYNQQTIHCINLWIIFYTTYIDMHMFLINNFDMRRIFNKLKREKRKLILLYPSQQLRTMNRKILTGEFQSPFRHQRPAGNRTHDLSTGKR